MSTSGQTPTVVSFGEDVLERMVLAVEKVRDRLRRATQALSSAGIPYAVAGGNAVAAWVSKIDPGAARNTVDVDLIINRSDLEAAKTAMAAAGFVYEYSYSVHMFLDGPDGRPRDAVHLLFAGEKVESHYETSVPQLISTDLHDNYQLLDLPSLVTMKLTSYRRKDQVHLQDMINVGLLDESWLARLPDALAGRLKQLLDDPQG